MFLNQGKKKKWRCKGMKKKKKKKKKQKKKKQQAWAWFQYTQYMNQHFTNVLSLNLLSPTVPLSEYWRDRKWTNKTTNKEQQYDVGTHDISTNCVRVCTYVRSHVEIYTRKQNPNFRMNCFFFFFLIRKVGRYFSELFIILFSSVISRRPGISLTWLTLYSIM